MDRSLRHRINKETADLSNAIDKIDLTDMYRACYLTTAENTFFKCPWNNF